VAYFGLEEASLEEASNPRSRHPTRTRDRTNRKTKERRQQISDAHIKIEVPIRKVWIEKK
jgi:hypothetical protein